jgi:hypothetical protein
MRNHLFMSVWAGDLKTSLEIPVHLGNLYTSIGHSLFVTEPEICAERELVPIEDLLEPFSLSSSHFNEAVRVAREKGLRLASVVLAVHTREPISEDSLEPKGCNLRFFRENQACG